jgi:hypothetical protein
MREVMSKLKLTVNEEKTRICTVPAGELVKSRVCWKFESGIRG